MSTRAHRPDTPADVSLRACLASGNRKSFVMVAGAGSGKTTSLVKALTAIVDTQGDMLRRNRQRVACITYTEIAAGEIWRDVGNNPLVHVSTIHSFLWTLVKSFQTDIREWVAQRIDAKIAELRAEAADFGPRVQQRRRDKNQRDIERREADREKIRAVPSFTYQSGSDYARGYLGHDDILKMVPELLSERPLFRSLLAQQFPFVFVDESQDTTENVVAALKAVQAQAGSKFCLGFFGDPMQRIYPTGIGPIATEEGWVQIAKPENFRCPATVLNVAKAIRREGDDLVQTGGRKIKVGEAEEIVRGTARIFVLPADDQRDERLKLVREYTARANADPDWVADSGAPVKVFVIVHRMAATRLGFADLYSALNDKAPDAFKNGFLDASAWPVRSFMTFILPLADAMKNGREFDAMNVLRTHCPVLAKEKLSGVDVAKRLSEVRTASQKLTEMMGTNSIAQIKDVLGYLRVTGLLDLDARIVAHLENQEDRAAAGNDGDEEEANREVTAMDAFLACPAAQFWPYREYVNEHSPFSTQQGIKGAEFEKVLVVLDDEEGTHSQFSYEKYLGIKPLSDRDRENRRQGKETAVERTRRLFYVCCTRAISDLAVVLFSENVEIAERQVRAARLFPDREIYTLDHLAQIVE